MIFTLLVESVLKLIRDPDNMLKLNAVNTLKRELQNDLIKAFTLSQPLLEKHATLFSESRSFLDFLLKVCQIPQTLDFGHSERNQLSENYAKLKFEYDLLQKEMEKCREDNLELNKRINDLQAEGQQIIEQLKNCQTQVTILENERQRIIRELEIYKTQSEAFTHELCKYKSLPPSEYLAIETNRPPAIILPEETSVKEIGGPMENTNVIPLQQSTAVCEQTATLQPEPVEKESTDTIMQTNVKFNTRLEVLGVENINLKEKVEKLTTELNTYKLKTEELSQQLYTARNAELSAEQNEEIKNLQLKLSKVTSQNEKEIKDLKAKNKAEKNKIKELQGKWNIVQKYIDTSIPNWEEAFFGAYKRDKQLLNAAQEQCQKIRSEVNLQNIGLHNFADTVIDLCKNAPAQKEVMQNLDRIRQNLNIQILNSDNFAETIIGVFKEMNERLLKFTSHVNTLYPNVDETIAIQKFLEHTLQLRNEAFQHSQNLNEDWMLLHVQNLKEQIQQFVNELNRYKSKTEELSQQLHTVNNAQLLTTEQCENLKVIRELRTQIQRDKDRIKELEEKWNTVQKYMDTTIPNSEIEFFENYEREKQLLNAAKQQCQKIQSEVNLQHVDLHNFADTVIDLCKNVRSQNTITQNLDRIRQKLNIRKLDLDNFADTIIDVFNEVNANLLKFTNHVSALYPNVDETIATEKFLDHTLQLWKEAVQYNPDLNEDWMLSSIQQVTEFVDELKNLTPELSEKEVWTDAFVEQYKTIQETLKEAFPNGSDIVEGLKSLIARNKKLVQEKTNRNLIEQCKKLMSHFGVKTTKFNDLTFYNSIINSPKMKIYISDSKRLEKLTRDLKAYFDLEDVQTHNIQQKIEEAFKTLDLPESHENWLSLVNGIREKFKELERRHVKQLNELRKQCNTETDDLERFKTSKRARVDENLTGYEIQNLFYTLYKEYFYLKWKIQKSPEFRTKIQEKLDLLNSITPSVRENVLLDVYQKYVTYDLNSYMEGQDTLFSKITTRDDLLEKCMNETNNFLVKLMKAECQATETESME